MIKFMKLRTLSVLALLGLAAGALFAQVASGEGEVRKIDPGQQKLTLKHGEIKAMDMPPMTMAYRVKDAAVLSQLQVGDRVQFTVEKVNGAYTLTSVRKAP
jgi:Cu/Ag efflux protein CusF